MKKFAPTPGTTFAEAKAWLRKEVDEGAECPCCSQLAKIYKRSITGSMAYALVLIERHFQHSHEWLHVPSYLTQMSQVGAAVRGGDWAKLTHWGLLLEKSEIRDDGSPRAGYYKITTLGVDFVNGRVSVPKIVHLYNGKALARPRPEEITIQEALGEKFNYSELMKR